MSFRNKNFLFHNTQNKTQYKFKFWRFYKSRRESSIGNVPVLVMRFFGFEKLIRSCFVSGYSSKLECYFIT